MADPHRLSLVRFALRLSSGASSRTEDGHQRTVKVVSRMCDRPSLMKPAGGLRNFEAEARMRRWHCRLDPISEALHLLFQSFFSNSGNLKSDLNKDTKTDDICHLH